MLASRISEQQSCIHWHWSNGRMEWKSSLICAILIQHVMFTVSDFERTRHVYCGWLWETMSCLLWVTLRDHVMFTVGDFQGTCHVPWLTVREDVMFTVTFLRTCHVLWLNLKDHVMFTVRDLWENMSCTLTDFERTCHVYCEGPLREHVMYSDWLLQEHGGFEQYFELDTCEWSWLENCNLLFP